MNIIQKLRSKEGCPWDREQTHESLRNCLLEESYETIEAINNIDTENLCEELGDILLQVALHSVIAEEQKEFTIQDVINGVSEKMIRRHPHVFGSVEVKDAEGVVKNWEEIKQKEKQESKAEELIRVPRALPANIRAEKVQKKAAKSGWGLKDDKEAFKIVKKQLEKLEKTVENGDKNLIQEEFGEVLFLMINLSRFLQLNAENSLTNATNKFINRFVDIVSQTEKQGQNLCEMSLAEQDEFWQG
jgi:tetrapyrrole methylase family protein/MazG family protein